MMILAKVAWPNCLATDLELEPSEPDVRAAELQAQPTRPSVGAVAEESGVVRRDPATDHVLPRGRGLRLRP